jgi:hypothetical protein
MIASGTPFSGFRAKDKPDKPDVGGKPGLARLNQKDREATLVRGGG